MGYSVSAFWLVGFYRITFLVALKYCALIQGYFSCFCSKVLIRGGQDTFKIVLRAEGMLNCLINRSASKVIIWISCIIINVFQKTWTENLNTKERITERKKH